MTIRDGVYYSRANTSNYISHILANSVPSNSVDTCSLTLYYVEIAFKIELLSQGII